MSSKKYNKYNYYRNTYAVFKEVNPSDLPFSVWSYSSKSGSDYFYTEKGVYRRSNHWGRAAKCRWVLEATEGLYVSKGRVRVGFVNWEGFYENKEDTKSYFIKVDFEAKTVTYDHKSRNNHSLNAVYRTAKDSQKIIQKVKRLLSSDAWAKYYEYENLENLRKEVILNLIAQ